MDDKVSNSPRKVVRKCDLVEVSSESFDYEAFHEPVKECDIRVLEEVSDWPEISDDGRATMDDSKRHKLTQTEKSKELFDESDKSMDTEVLVQEIGHKVIGLHCCIDLKCSKCLETCKSIYDILGEAKPAKAMRIGDFLVSVGFVELIQRILLSETEAGDVTAGIWSSVAMRLTDKSTKACFELMHIKLYEIIIKRLKIGASKSAASSTELCILYNVIQAVETARESFRELKIVDLLKQFIQNRGKDDTLYYMSIIFMAWVINDYENDIIDNEDIFNYLEQQLKSSIENESYRSRIGYKTTEILAAVDKLAVNDANKKRIIESGILRHYASFLSPSCDREEQLLAAQGVWSVALRCPEDVKKETSCIEGLESLLQCNETAEDVKFHAAGTLKEINDNTGGQVDKGNVAPALPSTTNDGKNSAKIFISYNHGSKQIVHRIKDNLKSSEYEVWIDEEKLTRSLAEEICRGIDSATVVLTFLSQKYYDSPYCQKELTYSNYWKKEIIPSIVERRYEPHGWISTIIDNDKWRIDFSGVERFKKSMTTLQRAIAQILSAKDRPDHGSSIEPGLTKETGHHIFSSPNMIANAEDVSCWTETEVKTWLKKYDLMELEIFFDDYNGKMLLAYKSSLVKDASQVIIDNFLKRFTCKQLCKLRAALTDF